MACGVLLFASAGLCSDAFTMSSSTTANNSMVDMRGFDPAIMTGVNDPHPDTSDPSAFLTGGSGFGAGVASGTSSRSLCFMRTDCTFLGQDTVIVGGDTNQSVPESFPEGGAGGIRPRLDPASGYYFLNYVEDGDDGAGGSLFAQGLKNDMLSYAVASGDGCGAIAAAVIPDGRARCNKTDSGFHQELAMTGEGSGGVGGGMGGAGGGDHGDGDQIFDLFFSVDALMDADGNLLGEAVGTFTQDYQDVTSGVMTTNSCSGAFTYSTATGYTGHAGECPP